MSGAVVKYLSSLGYRLYGLLPAIRPSPERDRVIPAHRWAFYLRTCFLVELLVSGNRPWIVMDAFCWERPLTFRTMKMHFEPVTCSLFVVDI